MADIKDLIEILTKGGPADTIRSATSGFEAGRTAANTGLSNELEVRKAKLAADLQAAGLYDAGELGDLPQQAGLNFAPGRKVTKDVLTDLTTIAARRDAKDEAKKGAQPASEAFIDALSETSGFNLTKFKGKGLTAQQLKDIVNPGLRKEGIDVARGSAQRSLEARQAGPVPQSITDKANTLREVQMAIDTAITNYDPKRVGPVEGRLGRAKQVVGLGDQSSADFYGASSAIQNAILKARSGSAVTPQEADRLLKEIPDANAQDYIQKMARLQKSFNVMVEANNRANQQYQQYEPVQTTAPLAEQPQQQAPSSVPQVGQTFNGGKVLKVTRIQ